VARRPAGAGPPHTRRPLPAPVETRVARPAKATALPRRTTGQEEAGLRPAPRQGAACPGPGITKQSPSPAAQTGMGLHTANGARKYLTAGERDAFLRQAELADRQVQTLCMTLAFAGCRLSEALALTADRVDLAAGVVVIESLKKRRTGVYRSVSVPPALLDALDMVHGIRELQTQRGKRRGQRLWPWSRMTGWRAVHGVMRAARLDGLHASRGCGTASGWPP